MKKVLPTLVVAAALTLACLPAVSLASSHGGGHDAAATRGQADYERAGFVTRMEEGRLWVFLPGSKELASFDKQGELAKHIVRPGAGPGGITIKAPDAETADAYLAVR